MKYQIKGLSALPDMPWESKPEGCTDVVWRYSANPVIPRNLIPCANSIFNSAVVPFEGKYAGVFRIDDKKRVQTLHAGFSDDGINWRLNDTRIQWINEDGELAEQNVWRYGYDPRCVFIEDRYWITWCNGYTAKGMPTIGVGYTYDFVKFYQCENAFLPFNRNGVLFPRKIDGKYVMFSRPSDSGHTPFGDIFISQSYDMKFWGEHRHVMSPKNPWEAKKIGAGPIPIETDEGWLVIYHGVLESCNGFVYSFGACILDIDKPWIVKHRCDEYILSPQTIYECAGDVPNVAFPCATLCDADTGRLAIYYGAADTVVGLAFTTVDELIDYIKAHDCAE